MPLKFSRKYETQIVELLSRLEVSEPLLRQEDEGFKPDFHIDHEFSSADIIGDIVETITTQSGEVIGKSFVFNGKTVELKDEAWRDLSRVAKRVQSAPDYREAVSLETLSNTIFEWLKDTYKDMINQRPQDFLSEKCEPLIQKFEAWIPIAETHVEGELKFGNIIFKQVTGAMIDLWEKEAIAHFPDRQGWPENFEHSRHSVQGLAAATMEVRAEPIRAYEIVVREAERSVALLRCLSSFNASPFLTSYRAPLGQSPIPSFWRFLTQNDSLVSDSHGSDSMVLQEHSLTQEHVEELRKIGLDHLDTLLLQSNPSSFENDLLSALLLYSRSSLQHSVADKLTYILAPLEFLLFESTVDPESLGERLALLNAQELQVRKNIVKNTKAVYQMRSRLIRNETNEDDLELLQNFMWTAWTFFINVIPNAGQFQDRAEFIRQIENWKLSGGLKGAI